MRLTMLVSAILLGASFALVPLRAEEPASEPLDPGPAADGKTAEAEAEGVERLIEQLASPDFETRERASRELLAIGEGARAALERTMNRSENMEARWRAEQILRRLDHEGERQMGQDRAPSPRPPDRGGAAVRRGTGWDDFERRLEEFRRRLDEGFGGFGLREGTESIEAPGLTLDVTTSGLFARVKLTVEGRDQPYGGRSLEDLLARYPDLADLKGMGELQQKWKTFKKAHPLLSPFERRFPLHVPGISLHQVGSGIQVLYENGRVKVILRETDENGVEKVRELEGESLEDIKQRYPEVREKLQGMGLSVQLGPRPVFRHRPGGLRLPVLPEAPPQAPTIPGKPTLAPFGVVLEVPESVLASHLGLEPGHGALVVQVLPRSAAESMGLERFDVIVAVDGRPVTDFAAAVDALRSAGREQTPLTLDVIRRGRQRTLSR